MGFGGMGILILSGEKRSCFFCGAASGNAAKDPGEFPRVSPLKKDTSFVSQLISLLVMIS